MKIKMKITIGSLNAGDILELSQAEHIVMTDSAGNYHNLVPADLEFIEDDKEELKRITLKEILGQDVQTIEFK